MDDLISRYYLIQRCKEIASHEWNKRASPVSWADAYEQFADDVEAEPSVDAVEVVRCKDCKWCINDEAFGGLYCHGEYMKADDFCSYGERKEK